MAAARIVVPAACWISAVTCFIAGTWGGRPALLPAVAPLVVIYIVSLARVQRQRTPPSTDGPV
jgi:hypothetical protein